MLTACSAAELIPVARAFPVLRLAPGRRPATHPSIADSERDKRENDYHGGHLQHLEKTMRRGSGASSYQQHGERVAAGRYREASYVAGVRVVEPVNFFYFDLVIWLKPTF
jgi:hypothetical protein